jgi:hypothetical protein
MIETAFRLSVVGAPGVGVSSLIEALASKYSPDSRIEGTAFVRVEIGNEAVILEFYVNPSVSIHGMVGVYDASRPNTFTSILPELESFDQGRHFIIANKLDRDSAFSCTTAISWCSENAAFHFNVSSRSDMTSLVNSLAHTLLRDFYSSQLEICFTITGKLIDHSLSWPFRNAVDEQRDGAPDYHKIIKKPMDLGTVYDKLKNNEYSSIDAWVNDMDLIWDNCDTYNGKGTPMSILAGELRRVFRKECKVFPPRGLKRIAQDLSTSMRKFNALLDQPPSGLGSVFPTGDRYTDADMRPFADKDVIALVKGVEELKTSDDAMHFSQICTAFSVPKTKEGNEDVVDVEEIQDDARVYIRSFLREKQTKR